MTEFVFSPRSATSPEGAGYLVGVETRLDRGGLRALLILDAERPEAGPIATVHMPVPIVGRVYGWWVPESELPKASGGSGEDVASVHLRPLVWMPSKSSG